MVIPVLVVVAIVGYLLGIHRSSAPSPSTEAPPPGETRVASGPNVLLSYPSSWQAKPARTSIPGLSLSQPLLLAPGGDTARAGLLSGRLPSGESSPLPASFLALVRGIPRTEVVSLANVQAYRYGKLNGYNKTLDVYVIPTAGSSPTAVICYVAKGAPQSYLHQCEQIAANMTLVGQTSYSIVPDAGYATGLGATLSALDKQRVKLRAEIHQRRSLAPVAPLARSLATRFGATAEKLDTLEPPQAATAAQTALAGALVEARDAYTALARAAEAEDPEAYDAALKQVTSAEAAVDKALENYTLLGYSNN